LAVLAREGTTENVGRFGSCPRQETGEPPPPSGTGGDFKLSVDLDFIAYREKQGLLVTQRPKARGKS